MELYKDLEDEYRHNSEAYEVKELPKTKSTFEKVVSFILYVFMGIMGVAALFLLIYVAQRNLV